MGKKSNLPIVLILKNQYINYQLIQNTCFMKEDKEKAIHLDLLYKGEQSIQNICHECILIMGQSRCGKSTLFNHIRDRPLIGKEILGICYEAQNKGDPSYAEMGAEYRSITLIPNIHNLTSSTTLIDLAGFGENRSVSGVMAVSYFLSVLFQKMKKVKFILVFEESMIYKMNFNGMAETFNSFIALFNFSAMKDSVRQNLFGSISFVISHATKSAVDYTDHFGEVAARLHKDKNLNKLKNKEWIVEIIQSVVKNKRIQDFPQAKLNAKAPQCTILSNLKAKSWDFFNFQDLKDKKNPQIVLPFQNDFASLEQEQKKQFEDYLSSRCKKVTLGFASLIKKFRETLITNWKDTISNRSLTGHNIVSMLLNSSQFFVFVDSFLHQTFETYRLQNFHSNRLKKQQKDPCLLESINSTLEMYDHFILSEVSYEVFAYQTTEQRLNHLAKQIPLLIGDMVCLCKDTTQFSKLQKLAFVMQRSIHEYMMFYKIKDDLLNDFQIKLNDQLTNVLGNKMDYLETIFNSVDLDFIRKLFDTIPSLCRFQQFIDNYIFQLRRGTAIGHSYLQDRTNYELKYRKLKVDINIYKLQISLNTQTSMLSLKRLPPLISLINTFLQEFIGNKCPSSWQGALKQFQLAKIKYAKLTGSLLMKLDPKQHPFKTRIGLDFSQLARCPFETDQFYQQALGQQAGNTKGLLSILQTYYKFQLRWGRIDEAVKTLFRMQLHYMQLQSYNGLKSVKQTIQAIEKNRSSYLKTYLSEIDKMDQPFDQQQEQKLYDLYKVASKKFQQPSLELTVRLKTFQFVPPPPPPPPLPANKLENAKEYSGKTVEQELKESRQKMYQAQMLSHDKQTGRIQRDYQPVPNPQRQLRTQYYKPPAPKKDNYLLTPREKNLSFHAQK